MTRRWRRPLRRLQCRPHVCGCRAVARSWAWREHWLSTGHEIRRARRCGLASIGEQQARRGGPLLLAKHGRRDRPSEAGRRWPRLPSGGRGPITLARRLDLPAEQKEHRGQVRVGNLVRGLRHHSRRVPQKPRIETPKCRAHAKRVTSTHLCTYPNKRKYRRTLVFRRRLLLRVVLGAVVAFVARPLRPL